uniref:Transmembrane protein 70 n=1 Tax=Sphenodon punctatus TaxID=8508 RepID=A0A8D0HLR7_SPHPU
MLLLAASGCRALGLQLAKRVGTAPLLALSHTYSAAGARSSRGLGASVSGNQIIFPHVKSVCCFSTSSHENSEHEHSEYGRLIYTGNLAKPVLGVKFFSYSTSMITFCLMPYVLLKTGLAVDNLALQITLYSILGAFAFITPVAFHLLTKGYVIRLYHSAETDTYTAITYNVILAEKSTAFHQKDVRVPDISKIFTTFYAKSKSMLVSPRLFPHPQDYSHLMGYDKPFHFDLGEENQSSEMK